MQCAKASTKYKGKSFFDKMKRVRVERPDNRRGNWFVKKKKAENEKH